VTGGRSRERTSLIPAFLRHVGQQATTISLADAYETRARCASLILGQRREMPTVGNIAGKFMPPALIAASGHNDYAFAKLPAAMKYSSRPLFSDCLSPISGRKKTCAMQRRRKKRTLDPIRNFRGHFSGSGRDSAKQRIAVAIFPTAAVAGPCSSAVVAITATTMHYSRGQSLRGCTRAPYLHSLRGRGRRHYLPCLSSLLRLLQVLLLLLLLGDVTE